MSDQEKEFRDFGDFLNIFNSESDRGAALLAASMMDEILQNLLLAFLRASAESQQLVSGFNAPLGTLHSRLLAAYSLGLIEEVEYADANVIRRIRNEFGHEWRECNFERGRIKDLCGQLAWRGPEGEKPTSRKRFDLSIVGLLLDWLWRERQVKLQRRNSNTWPSKGGPPRINV